MRLYSSLMAQAPVLNLGALPAFNAPFQDAGVPTTLVTNAVRPSSGNARLLRVYAGSGRYVYRPARSAESQQELSWTGGVRWANELSAANSVPPVFAVATDGDRISSLGETTHLGMPSKYITYTSGALDFNNSAANNGLNFNVKKGEFYTYSIEMAASRQLVGSEAISMATTGFVGLSYRLLTAGQLPVGSFQRIAVNGNEAAASADGAVGLYVSGSGTFGAPITIYFRRAMAFNATGMATSEAWPPFIDPDIDYGYGCKGVLWSKYTNGNTVSADGRLIEAEGAAISPPMGMQWQPTFTNLVTSSPPDAAMPGVTYLSFAASVASVAGLPAVRVSASTANNYLHNIDTSLGAPFSGRAFTSILFRKNANARPHLFLNNNTWYTYCKPNDDYTDIVVPLGINHQEAARLVPLGDDCFLMEFSVMYAGEAAPYAYFRLAKNDNTESYVANGEYLDVAALTVGNGSFSGTPVLCSGSSTARVADNPLTGLPAIGTGPFTALVEITPVHLGSSSANWYPKIFCADGDGLGVLLYDSGSGLINFYTDNSTNRNGLCTIAVGVKTRLIIRRTEAGLVSVFKDGVLTAEHLGGSIFNNVNPPKFGSMSSGYETPMIFHHEQLFYSALSDVICKDMTAM